MTHPEEAGKSRFTKREIWDQVFNQHYADGYEDCAIRAMQLFASQEIEYAQQREQPWVEEIARLRKALEDIRKECPVGSWFEKTCTKALTVKKH